MAAAEIFDIGAWLAMAELMLQGEGAVAGHALGAQARRRGTRRRHEREEIRIPKVRQMHIDTSGLQMHLSRWSACTPTAGLSTNVRTNRT